jgi:drug/metabolite transporter (DMT)-like permease
VSEPAARRPPAALQVALALGCVYLIWGSTYLAIRIAIETLPPLLMVGVRYVLAGGLLYGWARLRGAARPPAIQWRSAAVIGGLMLLVGNGGVAWAEQRVSSGVAALLASTVPLWMMLFERLRRGGARPGPRVVAGLALGFAGIVLLVRPGAHFAVAPAGAAVLLVGSLCWSFGSLYSRHAPLPASPLLATGMQMLAGGVLMIFAGVALGEPARLALAAVSLRSFLAFAYLVVFGALIGFTAYIWLLRVAPPALVSTYAYVNPVVAVFLGWALGGEPLTARTLAAAAVILTGVALITSARAGADVSASTGSTSRRRRAAGGSAADSASLHRQFR